MAHKPENFNLNSKLVRQLKAKDKMMESGDGLDWAIRGLAYRSCFWMHVRLSGQDSTGYFSHRHAVLVDQVTESRYFPLSKISPDQATFEVMDSPLSEFAVAGFEYGYALADPSSLTIEAQFGEPQIPRRLFLINFCHPVSPNGYDCAGLSCSCRMAWKSGRSTPLPGWRGSFNSVQKTICRL